MSAKNEVTETQSLEAREHYTSNRRWSYISNAWIFKEGWNDQEEIAMLLAQLAEARAPANNKTVVDMFDNEACEFAYERAPMTCSRQNVIDIIRCYLRFIEKRTVREMSRTTEEKPTPQAADTILPWSNVEKIERGTIEHLVKRQIPHLLLGLSQREPDEDGHIYTTDVFLSEIENTLNTCCGQLEVIMLSDVGKAADTLDVEGMIRALEEIREIWVGSECGEPVHAQEAYAIRLCKEMYQVAVDALRQHKPNEVNHAP